MRFPSTVYSSCRQSSLTLERTTMFHRASAQVWWWLPRETQTMPHLCLSSKFYSWILDFVLHILFFQFPVNVVLKITLWGGPLYRWGGTAVLVPRSPSLFSVLYQEAFSCSHWGPTPSSLCSNWIQQTQFEKSSEAHVHLRMNSATEIRLLSSERCPYSFTHTCISFRKCLLGVWKGRLSIPLCLV